MKLKEILKTKKLWIIITTFILIIFILIGSFFSFFQANVSSDLCANKINQEYQSPNKSLKVVEFSRDCGATTSDSTQVSIIKTSVSLKNESGNLFIMDSNHGQGSTYIQLNWANDEKVQITFNKNARVFKKEENFENIQIIYENF